MATVNDVIRLAFREANFKAIIDTLTAEEEAEGLILLQGLCDSFVPMVLGFHPTTLHVTGGATLTLSTRLLAGNDTDTTVHLPDTPQSGMVVEYVDAGHTADLILHAGERFFGDRQPGNVVVLNPAFPASRMGTRRWLYRDDTASWNEITRLQTGGVMPFPDMFLDWFVTSLAVRLSPRYGSDPRQITMMRMKQMEDFVRLTWRQTHVPDADSSADTGVPTLQTFRAPGVEW